MKKDDTTTSDLIDENETQGLDEISPSKAFDDHENSVDSQTLEEGFEQLEGVISNMEKDKVSIEEAFLLFEKGTKLIASLHEKLTDLEGRVEKLNEDATLGEFTDGQ